MLQTEDEDLLFGEVRKGLRETELKDVCAYAFAGSGNGREKIWEIVLNNVA